MKGGELETVFTAVERAGLVPRGAMRLENSERDGELAGLRTIVLAGMARHEGWAAFAAKPGGRRRSGPSARPLEPAGSRDYGARARRESVVPLAARPSGRSSNGRAARNPSIPRRWAF